MATSSASTLFITGGAQFNKCNTRPENFKSFGCQQSCLAFPPKKLKHASSLSVHAQYRDEPRGGGGGDFVAGFLLGGALFGTLAYVFAPQIRRSLLNEDEYGFRKAKRPIYYDDGLEKTRQTLNAKISQLNSAIDNVSSRLRGGNNAVTERGEAVEIDSEVEASM